MTGINYEEPFSLSRGAEDDHWLSFGRQHADPRRFQQRKHSGIENTGDDEIFVFRHATDFNSDGEAISFAKGPVVFGQNMYIYSPQHSIYLIANSGADWARLAKQKNQQILLHNVDDRNSKAAVRVQSSEGQSPDVMVVQSYLPQGEDKNRYLYGSKGSVDFKTNSNFPSEERWCIYKR